MQFMTMTLFKRCMYAKLHVIWSKSLLYIFLLINHIDSLCIQALSLNSHHRTFVFLCLFTFFAFYSFISNSHFLVIIQVFFKYFSVAILSILMMNSVNIMSVFLSWAFSLSFICSALYSCPSLSLSSSLSAHQSCITFSHALLNSTTLYIQENFWAIASKLSVISSDRSEQT